MSIEDIKRQKAMAEAEILRIAQELETTTGMRVSCVQIERPSVQMFVGAFMPPLLHDSRVWITLELPP
jgi:hypothetical protein